VQRFIGVDPLADKFAWVNPFNYAENEPIANIDLWGLQKTKAPSIKSSFHAGIVVGQTGYEFKALGSKVGGTLYHGSADLLGVSASYDDNNGTDVNAAVFTKNSQEKYGISAGDVFGGELSISPNNDGAGFTQTTKANLLLLTASNEFTKDSEGNTDNNQYIGLDFGISAGFILAFDISFSVDVNVTNSTPEGWKPTPPDNTVPIDNTKVEIITFPIDEKLDNE